MTKTSAQVVSHRFLEPVLPVMITVGTALDGSFVSNFEFGSLGFIWNLLFGAWIFHDSH